MKDGVVKIDGKTFYKSGNSYTRMQDENYNGKRTEYRKCPICKKLVSRQWQSHHNTLHK